MSERQDVLVCPDCQLVVKDTEEGAELMESHDCEPPADKVPDTDTEAVACSLCGLSVPDTDEGWEKMRAHDCEDVPVTEQEKQQNGLSRPCFLCDGSMHPTRHWVKWECENEDCDAWLPISSPKKTRQQEFTVSVDVQPENIEKLKADSRGRVTLGSDYSGKTVRVAVLDVED